MSPYRLSALAEQDLKNIARYSYLAWGEKQAGQYLSGLFKCIEVLALNPLQGRACDSVHSGYRRMEEGKHVVFYKPGAKGVFVSRILHQSMLPQRHSFMDA